MRFIIGILVTIGLIALILVLLLRGGGDSTTEVKTSKLADYANSGSSAHYTIDGPINAEEEHKTIKIDVSADQVNLTVYRGYQGTVVTQQMYPNNKDAYTVFLKALQTQGFTQANTDEALKDERGVCPLGERVIYAFDNGTKESVRSWSTSCGTGTYEGKKSAVRELFQRQVPDYGKQVSDSDIDF